MQVGGYTGQGPCRNTITYLLCVLIGRAKRGRSDVDDMNASEEENEGIEAVIECAGLARIDT